MAKQKNISWDTCLGFYDKDVKVRIYPFMSKKNMDKLPKKIKDKLKGKKPKK